MSRSSTMTVGFLLIFVGLQLHLVESFVLTPPATKFWAERWADPAELLQSSYSANQNTGLANSNYRSAYGNTAYGSSYSRPYQANRPLFQQASNAILIPPKSVTPPEWICWPAIFLGAVFVVFGLAVRKE